jgi:hypothetical protein
VLALHQSRHHAASDDLLKQLLKQIRVSTSLRYLFAWELFRKRPEQGGAPIYVADWQRNQRPERPPPELPHSSQKQLEWATRPNQSLLTFLI